MVFLSDHISSIGAENENNLVTADLENELISNIIIKQRGKVRIFFIC